jgi:hypothetical protein
MFAKAIELRHKLDVPAVERLADAIHHIGNDTLSKNDLNTAIKWLRRGYDLLNSQPIERLSVDGLDCRLAICQDIVQGLLAVGSTDMVQEASDFIAYLEGEIGNKPIVLHWQLEILQKAPGEVFDTEAYASVLRQMIRTFDFSDESLQFLLHHVRQLRERNSALACGLVDELLLQRLVMSGNTEWVDKTMVRRIWMATMELGLSDSVSALNPLLDRLHELHPKPLGPDAIGAIHSVGIRESSCSSPDI